MKTAQAKIILAIGGLDPSGHAGILADARVFHHFRIPCHVALTAVTAQSEKKFLSWEPVSLPLFRDQLRAAPRKIWGVKIGMLATPEHAKELAAFLRSRPPRVVLWDPVLSSSTGTRLFQCLKPHPTLWRLLKLADLFTPNLPEAEWFLARRLKILSDLEAAAGELRSRMKQGGSLVLKGGHWRGVARKSEALDLVAQKNAIHLLSAPRRPQNPRGTGCTFGAALLSYIYLGKKPLAAAKGAKRYVLNHVFHAPAP